MELKLIRKYKKAEYTIGRLYCNNKYICDTMEPPTHGLTRLMSTKQIRSRKAKYGPTAIPPGHYPLLLTRSVKFGKWLPLLMGVRGYEGIRIHAGNKPSETQGCILPGYNRRKGYLLESTTCLNNILSMLHDCLDKGKMAWIRIM